MATTAQPRPPVGDDMAADGDHVVAGNRLQLLPGGAERMAALEALIDGATRTLRILYYIFAADRSGRQVRDALVRAAERGVAVSLIIDGFGSSADAAFFAPLDVAGGRVCRFVPRLGRRYLLRNHQKLALADETVALIGGFNVEDDYFGDDASAWRDLGLRVEGPAAARIAGYFDALHDWVRTPDAKIRDLRHVLDQGSEKAGTVRWLMGGPTRSLSPWARDIKIEMRRARRLAIIAGYFAPNPAMLRRIEGVARRGGAASVMTAAVSDNGATVAAARHTYASLLKRGVRVYEYARSKLHTKLFVIDDTVHIGSANFDIRSLYLNCELMLRVEDAGFAGALRRYVAGEIGDAKEITRADHARAGLVDRLRWTIAYFFVAVVDGNVSRRLNFGPDGR